MLKNYNVETIGKLLRILEKEELLCDACSELHRILIDEGHKFIDSYNFMKTGFLERKVERKLYRDLDTNALVIVDTGEDYDSKEDGSYEPYYYIYLYVVDEELGKYEYELYYEYD